MGKKDWDADVRLTGSLDSRGQEEYARVRDEGQPFLMAVLGNFTGRAAGAIPPLVSRKWLRIDPDNFDEVLARCGVRWSGKLEGLPAGFGAGVELEFRSLEDFHPDRLVERTPALKQLLGMRNSLEDPARFDTVAAEVEMWAPPAARQESPRQAPSAARVDPSQLLGMILDKEDESVELKPADSTPSELQNFVRSVVDPHGIRVDAARQRQVSEAVERALSRALRSILRDPVFRELESLWRGLYGLVSRTVSEEGLRIQILQATRDELVEDMLAHESAAESALGRQLLEPASVPGGQPAALLVGCYYFSREIEDLALLERIGRIAEALKAPFVAGVAPQFLGTGSFEGIGAARDLEQKGNSKEWTALRRSRQARWLALALPRVVSRLPYGADTDSVDSFDFEEVTGNEHDALLWENPAFVVASVVAAAFSSAGWDLEVGEEVARLEGLPLFLYKEDGETMTKPCAESLLRDDVVGVLAQLGLTPLVSRRGDDVVALPAIQSIAEPRAPLTWRETGGG